MRYDEMTREQLIEMLEQQGEQQVETDDYPYNVGDTVDIHRGRCVVKRYYTEDGIHKIQMYVYPWQTNKQQTVSNDYTLMSMPVEQLAPRVDEFRRDQSIRHKTNKRG